MPRPVLRLRDGYPDTSPALRDDVLALQQGLAARGLKVNPDGFFGPGTDAAVRSFQQSAGLVVDGIVGPRSWATLMGAPAPAPLNVEFETTYPSNHAGLRRELVEAAKYRAFAAATAAKSQIPLCVLAGIGSRESAWGLMLKPTGPTGTGDRTPRHCPTAHRDGALPDDGGYGRGLMQIDFDAHEFARTGAWKDPAANIDYSGKVLGDAIKYFNGHAQLDPSRRLRAAVAAYNCGAGNVARAITKGLDLDYFTSGRDYSKDVLNRAGWFLGQGWC